MPLKLLREWQLFLPDWVAAVVAAQPPPYPDDEAAMELAIALARRNLDGGAGGPFGAVVIDRADGALVAAGVNCVFATGVASNHAEIVALALAHRATGLLDLGERPGLALVASAEPCAMCLGAIPWSGIRNLVIGARDADIRSIGFDEGAKPGRWMAALATRGISVRRDVGRSAAAAVLAAYNENSGAIYGSGV